MIVEKAEVAAEKASEIGATVKQVAIDAKDKAA